MLGVVGVVALASTFILITGKNPLSTLSTGFRDWLAQGSSLARPDTAWAMRIPGTPTSAAVAGSAVVVTMPGTVEAFDSGTGARLWSRAAPWGAVAGGDAGAVALVGRGPGYDVVTPASGEVRWSDSSAVGVWTYRNTILGLTCPSGAECRLTARAPADGATRWSVTLPGSGSPLGHALAGANPALPAARDRPTPPAELPAVLGFPIDRRVQAVDAATGALLRDATGTETTRVVVLGGRLLVISAVPVDGACRHSVEARDAATGASVWRRDGYDLGTTSAGCAPTRDPAGGDGVLAAIRGDNRAVYLSARTGQELFVGAPGESLLATDGRYGIVRSADRKQITGVDLERGGVVWTHEAQPRSTVAIIGGAVVITENSADITARLLALAPASGRALVDVTSQASVLGASPTGLILAQGRTVGFLRYGAGVG